MRMFTQFLVNLRIKIIEGNLVFQFNISKLLCHF